MVGVELRADTVGEPQNLQGLNKNCLNEKQILFTADYDLGSHKTNTYHAWLMYINMTVLMTIINILC